MKKVFLIIVATIKIAMSALVWSAVLWVVNWLISFTGIWERPNILHFLFGAVGLFILFFGWGVANVLIDMYRLHKYPLYKQMAETMGISWNDFKRYFLHDNQHPQT